MSDKPQKLEFIGQVEATVNNEYGEIGLISSWVTGYCDGIDEPGFEVYQREYFAKHHSVPLEQIEIVSITWSSIPLVEA